MPNKKFVIKKATRDRCKILKVGETNLEFFKQANMESVGLLTDAGKLPFYLYFKAEGEIVEFIKPNENSDVYIEQLLEAATKDIEGIAILILAKEYPLFIGYLKQIRQKKIDKLLKEDPSLDRKTLALFNNLSGASQMIVRGGVTPEVSGSVAAAAHQLVDGLMENTSAVGTLSKMVYCDPTLYDHSAAVAMIASVIAGKLLKKPFNKKAISSVAQCGLYHDVGKTCVPSHVLNKPGSFTPEEFEIMKTHTTLGYEEILKAKKDGSIIDDIVARVALEHHERFTGKGYPYQKKGRYEDDKENGIHIFTRIVTIADVYSALLMKRVYKPAYESGKAIKIMSEIAKDDFDPEIFWPFLKHVIESLNYHTKKKDGDKGKIIILDDKGKLKLSS